MRTSKERAEEMKQWEEKLGRAIDGYYAHVSHLEAQIQKLETALGSILAQAEEIERSIPWEGDAKGIAKNVQAQIRSILERGEEEK